MRHDVELSILAFKRPVLLKHNEIIRIQGMVTYIRNGCLLLIRPSLNEGAMKFK